MPYSDAMNLSEAEATEEKEAEEEVEEEGSKWHHRRKQSVVSPIQRKLRSQLISSTALWGQVRKKGSCYRRTCS